LRTAEIDAVRKIVLHPQALAVCGDESQHQPLPQGINIKQPADGFHESMRGESV
jgi:hypothetical protein